MSLLLKEEQNLLITTSHDESNDLLKGFSEKHNENNLLTYKHKYLIDEKYEIKKAQGVPNNVSTIGKSENTKNTEKISGGP